MGLTFNGGINVPAGTNFRYVPFNQNTIVPDITVNNISIDESAGSADFTISLSEITENTVSVDYLTTDGTATVAGLDYTATSGTAEFLPGQLTKIISVPINDDPTPELDETFTLNLSNGKLGTITSSVGTATIVDNDGGDPNFANVKGLFHFDNNLTDVTGNASLSHLGSAGSFSTSSPKFGTHSLTNGYGYQSQADAAKFQIGTDNFTYEGWFKSAQPITNAWGSGGVHGRQMLGFRASTTAQILFAFQDNGVGGVNLMFNDYGGTMGSASSFPVDMASVITQNVWFHAALVRNGNVITGYIDGTEYLSKTTTDGSSHTRLVIGGWTINTPQNRAFSGQIDDVRFTKSIARYTANFSVPTEAFPDS